MTNNSELYSQGCRFLCFSEKENKFFRIGNNIVFFNNIINKENLNNNNALYFEA